MVNTTKIYLVTNCYGDPNKVYIGKTTSQRFYPHKKTYGKDIIYIYIDEIPSLNKNEWKSIECYWIEQFKQWGFNVLNKNNGGGGPIFYNEIIREKMRKPRIKNPSTSLKGRSQDEEHKRKRATSQYKPINQYDINGNFIASWESATIVAERNGWNRANIHDCCRGKQKTSYGFIWKYIKY